MPIAFEDGQTWDYVLCCDRELPESERTVFEIAALDVAEEARLKDGLAGSEGGTLRIRTGTAELETLRLGLRGVRNFKNAKGADVPFDVDKSRKINGRFVVADAFLNRLHAAWRKELAEAIAERNTLTEAEKKIS